MTGSPLIRGATVEDWPAVLRLLQDAGLPTEDLDGDSMARFFVAEHGRDITGTAGLDTFGDVALLRSLVVERAMRGNGIARALMAALERRAIDAGVGELWLLTIDAEEYFLQRGFRRRERVDAPARIRTTPEFSTLCPGTAVLMSRRLAE